MDWKKELQDLDSLRRQGILTQREFDEEKSRVLASRRESMSRSPKKTYRSFPDIIFGSSNVPADYQAVQVEDTDLTLIKRLLSFYGIGVFISIFLKWTEFPGTENNLIPKDYDQLVVGFLFFGPFMSLIALSILFTGNPETRGGRLIGFLTPYLITQTIPDVWGSIDLLFITPIRNDIGTGEYYSSLGPGLWIFLLSVLGSLLTLSFLVWQVIEKQTFDYGEKLKRDTSFVIPLTGLLVIGFLYGALKPNPNLNSDFAPFADTYKTNWESWFSSGVLEPVLYLLACVLVAKFRNPTMRNAGIFSLAYLAMSTVFYIIAFNAQTETNQVWSFGGSIIVISAVSLGLLGASKISFVTTK